MKYRFITVGGGGQILWGKDEITKETLAMVKDGRYETIIDWQMLKYYNAEENKWEDIKGD